MEDPGEEWEIVEYPPSWEGEEASQSKISWILSKGLWLGKKVMITGFVVSSAPLVLPPLVVVSALGFAVSVPFGVVFASYRCTEKLMNKLLPLPEPYGTLDYGPPKEDVIDEGEFAMEEEEKKQIQDTKENVETRIELVDDGNKMPEMDPNTLNDSGMTVQEKSYNEEAVKEKGYEEDDGEYLEGDDEGSLRGTNVKLKGRDEGSVEESLIKETKDEMPQQPVVKRVVVVVEGEKKNDHDVKKACEVTVIGRPVKVETESAVSRSEEPEVLKKESVVLLDKSRDEGSSGESTKKNKKKSKHRLKKALGLCRKKDDESAVTEKEIKSEIRHEKVAAGVDKLDARQAVHITPEEKNRTIEINSVSVTGFNDRENAQVTEETVGSQSILINGDRSVEQPNLVNEGVIPTVRKKEASKETTVVVSSDPENVQVEKVESNAVPWETAGKYDILPEICQCGSIMVHMLFFNDLISCLIFY